MWTQTAIFAVVRVDGIARFIEASSKVEHVWASYCCELTGCMLVLTRECLLRLTSLYSLVCFAVWEPLFFMPNKITLLTSWSSHSKTYSIDCLLLCSHLLLCWPFPSFGRGTSFGQQGNILQVFCPIKLTKPMNLFNLGCPSDLLAMCVLWLYTMPCKNIHVSFTHSIILQTEKCADRMTQNSTLGWMISGFQHKKTNINLENLPCIQSPCLLYCMYYRILLLVWWNPLFYFV